VSKQTYIMIIFIVTVLVAALLVISANSIVTAYYNDMF
jgi:hypothetical protein